MIPIGDDVPKQHYPFVTYGLIGLNVFFLLCRASTGASPGGFFVSLGNRTCLDYELAGTA